jgi:hypothetical protein
MPIPIGSFVEERLVDPCESGGFTANLESSAFMTTEVETPGILSISDWY